MFISSVRRGLEEERDALPGMVAALGHVPVRFEDFTAQPVPSRQACMDAVASADVCLLLLGPAYGDPMPDTGVSPTHEEFNVARARGIPVYVFLKRGINMEPDQRTFVDVVERYATGRFRASFDGAAGLLIAAANAIREHERAPSALTWEILDGRPPDVPWVVAQDVHHAPAAPLVELHLLPTVAAPRLVVAQLEDLARALAVRGREHALFTQGEPVDTGTDGIAAWASSDEPRTGSAGVRVARERCASLWWPLPKDQLGAVLDVEHLAGEIASKLRLAASLGVVTGPRLALAAGLAGIALAAEGRVAELGARSSASFGFPRHDFVQVPPEDSIPTDALVHGAADIGREVTARLVTAFRRSRR